MTTTPDVQQLLGLRTPPVAIAFLAEPPANLRRWSGPPQPAGCAFWQKAHAGEAFYTVAADHFGCAVGAYTHAIELPAERSAQLGETIDLMVGTGYLKREEVPGIPRLAQSPAVVAYGPADRSGFPPDVVLLAANPSQTMLIYEAALRSGAGQPLANLLGRPSCGVLPLTLKSGEAAVSVGCAGNRLYAGLQESEMYVSIPGTKWEAFKARLVEIVDANQRMGEYYTRHEAEVRGGA